MTPTRPMDDALAEVQEARAHAKIALDIVEKRRDLPQDAEELRHIVGALAGMATSWECERNRWR